MSSEIFRREVEAHALGTTADLLAAVGRAREEREACESVGICVGKRFDSTDQLQELRLALAQQAALAAERELELRLSGMAASLDWGWFGLTGGSGQCGEWILRAIPLQSPTIVPVFASPLSLKP